MSDFKGIFWWEWGHRFLGRFIGLSFLIPGFFFLFFFSSLLFFFFSSFLSFLFFSFLSFFSFLFLIFPFPIFLPLPLSPPRNLFPRYWKIKGGKFSQMFSYFCWYLWSRSSWLVHGQIRYIYLSSIDI